MITSFGQVGDSNEPKQGRWKGKGFILSMGGYCLLVCAMTPFCGSSSNESLTALLLLNGGDGALAAPTIGYGSSPLTTEINDPVTLTPSVTGTSNACAVTPDLPTGMTISTTDCIISGTPTVLQVATDYTVRVTNGNGSGTTAIRIEVVPDNTAPGPSATAPADGALSIAPNNGSITIVFDDAMDTSLTPTLTTEAWNGSGYVSIPNAGTHFAWSNYGKALTINISWIQFPENTKLRWTLAAASLKDNSGNQLSGDIQRTFTTNSRNTYFMIADTGQTVCYDSTSSISCGDSGYPRQDGDFVNSPLARNFAGPTAHPTYTSDFTTTDILTGLVWKTCSEGRSGPTCSSGSASAKNWYNGINGCASLNTANGGAGYAGLTNWRLPARLELETLIDYGVLTSATIDPTGFPGTVSSQYSNSTTYTLDASKTWPISFNNGNVSPSAKSNSLYIRCVSSGP